MKDHINVAVIGCGCIANSAHIPSYIKSPVAQIKYFCDIIPEKADECVEKIMGNNPAVVYCLGDLSLLYRVVELLKAKGVKVVTACNERIVSKRDEGKIAGFRFVQFREF